MKRNTEVHHDRKRQHEQAKELQDKWQQLESNQGKSLKEHLSVFNDAVIAIISTIMVLEIPLPIEGEGNFHEFIISILIFIISFFVVSNFWYENHKYTVIIPSVDKLYLVMNFLFLAGLSLMPMMTKWLMHTHSYQAIITMGIVYLFVNTLNLLLKYRVYHHIFGETDFAVAFSRKIIMMQIILIFILNLIVIALAAKWPVAAMIVYFALPIISFISPEKR